MDFSSEKDRESTQIWTEKNQKPPKITEITQEKKHQ